MLALLLMSSLRRSLLVISTAAITACFISFFIELAACDKVHIALRLSEALCEQRAKYIETKELPPPSKTPREGPCGHVVWNKCSQKGENGICNPFEKKPCSSGGPPSESSHTGGESGNTGAGNGEGLRPDDSGKGGSSPSGTPQQGSSGHEKEVTIRRFRPATHGTPFMVAIEIASHDFSGWSLVGHGTIIDEVTILTTASIATGVVSSANAPHLFTYSGLRVLAGVSNRSVTDNAQIAGVCAMSVYNDASGGDLGLIHLNKSLSMNEHVKKIELPSEGQTRPRGCQYASWGKPKKIIGSANYRKMAYEGTVLLISSADCDSMEPSFFCTTPASCGMYDSGAPLVCNTGTSKVVYGISSQTPISGAGPQKCGDNSVFTSLANMDRDWVEQEKSSAQKHCKRSK